MNKSRIWINSIYAKQCVNQIKTLKYEILNRNYHHTCFLKSQQLKSKIFMQWNDPGDIENLDLKGALQ